MSASEDSGGYECHVVDEDHDLSCPICLMILKEPQLMSCCGVKTCSSCMTSIKEGSNPECPWCREKDFTTMLDKSTMRQVMSLEVYCSNKNEAGCDWIGELRCLDEHLKSCFVHVPCKYKCGYQCHVKKSEELIQHETNECELRPEVVLAKEVSLLKEKVTSLEGECEERKQENEREKGDYEKEMKRLRRDLEELTMNFEEKDRELNKCKKMMERDKNNHLQALEKAKESSKKEVEKLQMNIQNLEAELKEIKESVKHQRNSDKDDSSSDSDSDTDELKKKRIVIKLKSKEEEEELDGDGDICTKCTKKKACPGLTQCTFCITCPSCHQPLNDDTFITTTEGRYHQKCFYCFNCQRKEDIVAETSGSGLVCQSCLDNYFITFSSTD